MGYWIGQVPPGYQIIKKMTEHGKRTMFAPHPDEYTWFFRMFELVAEGLSNQEVCDKVNDAGYIRLLL